MTVSKNVVLGKMHFVSQYFRCRHKFCASQKNQTYCITVFQPVTVLAMLPFVYTKRQDEIGEGWCNKPSHARVTAANCKHFYCSYLSFNSHRLCWNLKQQVTVVISKCSCWQLSVHLLSKNCVDTLFALLRINSKTFCTSAYFCNYLIFSWDNSHETSKASSTQLHVPRTKCMELHINNFKNTTFLKFQKFYYDCLLENYATGICFKKKLVENKNILCSVGLLFEMGDDYCRILFL